MNEVRKVAKAWNFGVQILQMKGEKSIFFRQDKKKSGRLTKISFLPQEIKQKTIIFQWIWVCLAEKEVNKLSNKIV